MKVCGIICEYNPFHRGHAHQIAQIRALLGEDAAIVCCMSGNFVQRGEAAVAPKHIRAEAALLGGADLVLELPLPYALSSAEGFARAGVGLLLAAGVVTDIAFGAEDADLPRLTALAQAALEKSTIERTLEHLQSGIPYARARERALHQKLREESELLRRPNNILAVEYLKALIAADGKAEAHAFARGGAGHDGGPHGDFASAGWLRQTLRAGGWEAARPYLTPESFDLLQRAREEGRLLLDLGRLENAVLSHLLRLTPEDLAALPGASEGLEHRLYAAIRRSRSVDGIWQEAKTKRYAASRLRRMLMCAFLGVTAEEQAAQPPYLRVLGFSDAGRGLLRRMAEEAALPVVVRPGQVHGLGPQAQALFDKEMLADDLYALALPSWRDTRPGDGWRRGAVMV